MPLAGVSAAPFFPPGSLSALAAARGVSARATGALQPIATELRVVEDGGVRFLVRQMASLRQKEREKAARRAIAAAGTRPANPFLPPDRRLLVADVSPTHVCLLNKYNVVDRHLLIVTRAYEDQEAPLTPADFEAMAICMGEIDGLGFYNGGTIAGASQPHKHLQLVPLPLADVGPRVPIEPLLPSVPGSPLGSPLSAPDLPFRHAVCRLADVSTATMLYEVYLSLMTAAGLVGCRARGAARARPSPPYNLLMTRDWMLVVPRRHESAHGISLNALGFAGSLFVRDDAEMSVVERVGPMRMLRAAALPAE
jgi:ATP adenylyltransferase